MDNKQVLYKPNKKKHFWTGGITSQKVVFSVVFVLFAIYALSMIIPFCILILYSLENNIAYEINLGQPFRFPDKLVFDNYIYAFSELEYRGTGFFGMVFNSVWYTAIATVGPLLANTCVGYAVSKYKFKLRNVYYGVLIFCMTVPIIGTTGATMQLYADLRLYNTGPLLQLFTRLGAGGIGFLVIYAFFKNISWEYAEAALIDGAGHFTVFFRIMVPMAIPRHGGARAHQRHRRLERVPGRAAVQPRLADAGERPVRPVAHVAAAGQHAGILCGAGHFAHTHTDHFLPVLRQDHEELLGGRAERIKAAAACVRGKLTKEFKKGGKPYEKSHHDTSVGRTDGRRVRRVRQQGRFQ